MNEDAYSEGNITIRSTADPTFKKDFTFDTQMSSSLSRLISTKDIDVPLGT